MNRVMLARNGIFVLVLVLTPVISTMAQNAPIVGELERLRRDINTLQSYVFRDGKGSVNISEVDGVSKFANQDAVSQIQLQVQKLRRQMREMNGYFEEIQFKISRTAERLDRLVADIDLRMRALENNKVSAVSSDGMSPKVDSAIPSDHNVASASDTLSKLSSNESKPGINGQKERGKLIFGKISRNDLKKYEGTRAIKDSQSPLTKGKEISDALSSAQRTAVKPTSVPAPSPVSVARKAGAVDSLSNVLPAGSPKEQYDFAYGLLLKRDLPKAELALKAFLQKHEKHDLADNAIFWLGETYYVRKNYEEAIKVYYNAYKNYPAGNKAPAVLLKLGMSLAAIGEKESACSAYEELASVHPKANQRILKNAVRGR